MSTMSERRKYEAEELERLRKELREQGYFYHHSASEWGYFEVGRVELIPYKGKYGVGYKLAYHRNGIGGTYHFIEYWIKED